MQFLLPGRGGHLVLGVFFIGIHISGFTAGSPKPSTAPGNQCWLHELFPCLTGRKFDLRVYVLVMSVSKTGTLLQRVGKGQLDSGTGAKSHSGGTCVSLSDLVCLEECRGTAEGGWHW